MRKEQATFGAGCYWGTENFFRTKLSTFVKKDISNGISDVKVGFMGGTVINPTYRQVCETTTKHVEVAQIEYDPNIVSYDLLCEFFFSFHDPTEKNRQGMCV